MRKRNMIISSVVVTIALALFQRPPCHADSENPNTDWFRDARYGVFMHLLPRDANSLALADDFDANALAEQLESVGAGYFVLTLGQNSGFMNSPNPTYSRYTGYEPGQRCSKRDLPIDIYKALRPKGIRLMLYLPCQVPNGDARAQKAFGLPQGAKDQPIDVEFARKWAEVIYDWSSRYKEKVAGWWFDGGYEWIGFNEQIAEIYADAVKRGNPKAIVTFNPGVKLIRWTMAEDYTAGELNEPFGVIPTSRWVDCSQWHALTFLGSHWSGRDTRYATEKWASWVRAAVLAGGVVTIDAGPNWNPKEGSIGSMSQGQINQLKAIRDAQPSLPKSNIIDPPSVEIPESESPLRTLVRPEQTDAPLVNRRSNAFGRFPVTALQIQAKTEATRNITAFND
ncbi:MAG: alpha-L-fucosidase [Pirellulales bacterium]|nr:alpha-L-fucosidase [Pirellulales bacterium]